jgi:hypothetical protein
MDLFSRASCGASGSFIDGHCLFPEEGDVGFVIKHGANFAGERAGA